MSIFLYALLFSAVIAFIIVRIKKGTGWIGVLDFVLYTCGLAFIFEIIAISIVLSKMHPGD